MADHSMQNVPMETATGAATGTATAREQMPGMSSQSLLRFDEGFQTFANHLSMSATALQRLKLPPWLLFPAVSNRRDQAKLSDSEKQRFLCAFDVLNQTGVLGQFVEVHGQSSHRMHGTLRFLPWHRVYLAKFEQALRSIHPDVTIPYWDWTQAAEQSLPPWLSSVNPTVVTPSRTIHVVRSPGTGADLNLIAANTPTALAQTDFTNFTGDLEGVHNGVHVWVGGSMGAIPTAPADPVFWMHHANIDRLWAVWQKSPAGTGKNPPLAGADLIMDPYPNTEADTRDTTTFGYVYV